MIRMFCFLVALVFSGCLCRGGKCSPTPANDPPPPPQYNLPGPSDMGHPTVKPPLASA